IAPVEKLLSNPPGCVGFQFNRTVIGELVDVSTGWLIKKRPSRDTAYSCLLAPAPGTSVTGNSAAGVPAANVAAEAVTGVAINLPSAVRGNCHGRSLPLLPLWASTHMGSGMGCFPVWQIP